ncbi:hypothetical protein B2G69_07735 [Methylorubrum zatmanii]|nr:hypothetical protein [Methylorubrum zatmanii]ARO54046.1 hypothetical protein B2G69_07735 [Methylorubrum zatmanii]
MAKSAYDMIHDIVSKGREAGWDDRQIAAGINTVLRSEGFMPDTEATPKAPDPLTSTIQWSTDFTTVPEPKPGFTFLVLSWKGRFEMTCRVFETTDSFTRFFKSQSEVREVVDRKDMDEFAWSQIVSWPPAAHEAIADRLQAEADAFAKKAADARKAA